MFELLRPALESQRIEARYGEDAAAAFTPGALAAIDVVLIYKDDGQLGPEAERALLEFVEAGHGLVAIHCASHAFRNSDAYTRLVGGRFLRHGHEAFRATIIDAQHPALAGVSSFATRDETYVHNELAPDIRVLMVRPEGDGYEPYTWVRGQKRGRVYYTALGHDEATWRNPAFHRLLLEAIRWTADAADAGESAAADASDPEQVRQHTQHALESEAPAPLSPAESIRRMHLPEGFGIELFAAEPQIVKPITMAFDARGRVWLVESVDYPNDVLEPFAGHDRIKICEDTDGDGRADKFTVFADGLNIPTSLLPYRDGVLVALAPHIVLLRDTDGDDRCDRREILLSGFGRADTHAVHSNFRWGLDNWVWGTVGYSGGDIEAGGRRHRFRQGVFRFRPDGSDFELLTGTSNNTWGLGFRETGEAFISTANGQHSVHLAIPNRYYERVRGWHGQGSEGIADHQQFHAVAGYVRQVDWHGGYTAAAGQTVYTARQFPPEYADRATLVCEPTGHLVHIDWLVPQGSAYLAKDGWNLLASDDPWCAPIETHVGPDGAVWLIDWYNYIVRHNPTPPGFETGKGNAYITPQRDKSHGRIYRIVYHGAPGDDRAPAPATSLAPTLHAAGSDELVDALEDGNLWRRTTAQRLLVERNDPSVAERLIACLHLSQPAAAIPHALWVLDHYGVIRTRPEARAAVVSLLEHPWPAVRRAALAVLPRDRPAVEQILATSLLDDTDQGIRLAALLALAEMPDSPRAAAAVVRLLNQPAVARDRWLPDGAIAAAATSAEEFLRALADAEVNDATQSNYARAARVVAEHWARGAEHGGLAGILASVAAVEPALAAAVVAGLATGWPAGEKIELDDRGRQSLERLFARLPADGQLRLVELARRWNAAANLEQQMAQIETSLLAKAGDENLPESDRLQAVAQLAAVAGREEILARLMALVSVRSSSPWNEGILAALANCKADAVGRIVLDAWPRITPAVRRQAIATLLRRPVWTAELLSAISAGAVARDDLALDQVQQLLKHPQRKIAARAQEVLSGGRALVASDRQRVLAEFLPLASTPGDPQLGRKVFEQQCAKCHRHGALGESVGPDLTGIAARRREEILTDLLDPNRSVEGNYRQYTISTSGGELFTGLLLAETQTAYELLDSQAKRHVVLRADVDEFSPSSLSVMPEGFEKLPAAELTGLIEFLAARGKYLPLPLAKVATIVSTRGMFYDRAAEVERLILPDWGPVTVAGVPFQLVDPRGERVPNVVLLHGPPGAVSQTMPEAVSIPCGLSAQRIHLLSGVSGWGYPVGTKGTVSMIVRLHYAGGETEDHPLENGVHFADYIRRVDVPGSQFAFAMREQQMRYLAITPRKPAEIDSIELIKGNDQSAPIVLAVTLERPGE